MRVSIAVFFLWLAVGAGIIFEQEPWGKDALTFGAGLSLLSWGIITSIQHHCSSYQPASGGRPEPQNDTDC